MCDLGLITQGAGAVTKAGGAFFTAKGQQLALRNDAEVADLNARLADDAGRFARQRGLAEGVAAKLQTGQIKSAQRVGIAAGGADLGEGTAANVQISTEIMGQIDALTIDANAVREQGQRTIEASNYRSEAKTKRIRAAAISPFADAAISLLGSVSDIGSSYGTSLRSNKGAKMGLSDQFQAARSTSLYTPRLSL